MSEKPDNTTETTVTFKLSEDESQLIAKVPGGTDIFPLNITQLNRLLIDEGHTDWHLLADALAKVCSSLGKLSDATDIIIGDRLDGELVIEISDDATCVTMSVTPPIGGNPVTSEQVHEALSEKGITQGIKKDAIKHVLSNHTTEKSVIAEGTAPQHGADSTFESLISEAKDTRPLINDDGSVDYHEIGAFITVNAGDQLMRKTPPTTGTNGVDVYGKIITATPGKDLAFSNRLKGVEVDSNDQNLLVAITGGQPEIVENGMSVNPVINVKDVGLSTGNIDFDGTVNIQGDVAEGMKIIATGDIIVTGTVEGAELQADGNIVIRKGIIGRGELRTEEGEPGQGAAQLTSEGSIEAQFIGNAIVHANENISVRELISHSEISALNQIVVGKKGAKKGHILGGKTRAVMGVQAQILGSQANVKTIVEVGNNPELHENNLRISNTYNKKMDEYEKLSTLINRLKGQPDEKSKTLMARVLNTLQNLNETLATIKEEKSLIEAQDQLTDDAKVTVGKHAFPMVSITIGANTHTVQDRTEAGTFILDDKKIVLKYN